MMPWQVWTVGIVCLLFVGNALLHLIYALSALKRFEQSPLFNVAPPPTQIPSAEPLRIATADDVSLHGLAFFPIDGVPQAVVVFCPETGGTAATSMNYIPALLERGFAVVAFEFRNQGQSEAQQGYHPTYWMTEFELRDLHAVIDFVKEQPQFDGLSVGLAGVSRGANIALVVAASREDIDIVWTQGAFPMKKIVLRQAIRSMEYIAGKWSNLLPRWHVRVTLWVMLRISEMRNHVRFVRLEPHLAKLRNKAVMFVSGSRDSYIPPEIVRSLCVKAGKDPERFHWVVTGAKHNLERLAAREEYDQRLTEFFNHLLPPVAVPHRQKSAIR